MGSTWLIVGLFSGWVVGVTAEVIYGFSMVRMMAGGMAGALIGALVDFIIYRIKLHSANVCSPPKPPGKIR